MAEIPRLRQGSGKINGLNENMDTKKIWVSEHMINGINAKPDNSIVDMESFSNSGLLYNRISADSRITLPRSFSRKGYHRGAGDSTSMLVAAATSSSSPGGILGPSCSMQEKPAASSHPPVVIAVGPTEDSDNNPQPNNHNHHQITMKSGSVVPVAVSTAAESQLGRRRSPLPWYSHPRRVLLFFATISSIGTLLLICFTLAISKRNSSSSD